MAWVEKLANVKGITTKKILSDLIEEARQDNEDYEEAMEVIHAKNREYVSAEQIKSRFGLWSIAGNSIVKQKNNLVNWITLFNEEFIIGWKQILVLEKIQGFMVRPSRVNLKLYGDIELVSIGLLLILLMMNLLSLS